MGCLYKLMSPSGKSYIGISKHNLDARWKSHLKDAKRENNYALYNAIRKYGAEAFRREVLVIATDAGYLLELEKKAIKVFATMSPRGYNLVAGGRGVLNPSLATKGRMRAAQIARFSVPAEREKASRRTKAAWTPERAAAMARRVKAYFNTEKAKIAARKRLVKQRENPAFVVKAKAAASKKMKELWADPEYRARMIEFRRHPSKESLAKRSEGLRRAWAKKPKETRIGTRRGMRHTEETKRKMSASANLRSTPEYCKRLSGSLMMVWTARKNSALAAAAAGAANG